MTMKGVVMAKSVEARIERLEAAQRAELARSTPPIFLLQFHDAVDGRDAGVAFEVWFGEHLGEARRRDSVSVKNKRRLGAG